MLRAILSFSTHLSNFHECPDPSRLKISGRDPPGHRREQAVSIRWQQPLGGQARFLPYIDRYYSIGSSHVRSRPEQFPGLRSNRRSASEARVIALVSSAARRPANPDPSTHRRPEQRHQSGAHLVEHACWSLAYETRSALRPRGTAQLICLDDAAHSVAVRISPRAKTPLPIPPSHQAYHRPVNSLKANSESTSAGRRPACSLATAC